VGRPPGYDPGRSETVKDYRLEFDGPQGQDRLRVDGNYLGGRVHRLPEPVVSSTLRLMAETTHGTPEARVFEIRAY
jgi:hypothetical protein